MHGVSGGTSSLDAVSFRGDTLSRLSIGNRYIQSLV